MSDDTKPTNVISLADRRRESEGMQQGRFALLDDDPEVLENVHNLVDWLEDDTSRMIGLFTPPDHTGWAMTADQATELGVMLIRAGEQLRMKEGADRDGDG